MALTVFQAIIYLVVMGGTGLSYVFVSQRTRRRWRKAKRSYRRGRRRYQAADRRARATARKVDASTLAWCRDRIEAFNSARRNIAGPTGSDRRSTARRASRRASRARGGRVVHVAVRGKTREGDEAEVRQHTRRLPGKRSGLSGVLGTLRGPEREPVWGPPQPKSGRPLRNTSGMKRVGKLSRSDGDGDLYRDRQGGWWVLDANGKLWPRADWLTRDEHDDDYD